MLLSLLSYILAKSSLWRQMEKSNLKKYDYSIAILDKTEQKICYQKNNSVAMILEKY